MDRPTERLRWGLFGDDRSRLRAPWRLLVGTMVFVTAGIVIGGGVVLGFGRIGYELSFFETAVGTAIIAATGLITAVAGLALIGRIVDRQPLATYGLAFDRQWWIDAVIGFGIGGGVQTGIFGVGTLIGVITIDGIGYVGPRETSFGIALLSLGILYVAVGILEEVVLRGWLMTNIAAGARSIGHFEAAMFAAACSAVVFGTLHLGNPNATGLSWLVITMVGGVCALAYAFTGRLGIPIGFHTAWNLFQGPVYGLPVSGIPAHAAVIETTITGSSLVIDHAFGPEGGVLGIVGAAVAGGAVYLIITNRTVAAGVSQHLLDMK